MNTVTHVAGPAVVVPGKHDPSTHRVIQRCALCGEKLIDTEGQMVPVMVGLSIPDGVDADMPPIWAMKAFVRIDGNRHTKIGDYAKDDDPKDFCVALVE